MQDIETIIVQGNPDRLLDALSCNPEQANLLTHKGRPIKIVDLICTLAAPESILPLCAAISTLFPDEIHKGNPFLILVSRGLSCHVLPLNQMGVPFLPDSSAWFVSLFHYDASVSAEGRLLVWDSLPNKKSSAVSLAHSLAPRLVASMDTRLAWLEMKPWLEAQLGQELTIKTISDRLASVLISVFKDDPDGEDLPAVSQVIKRGADEGFVDITLLAHKLRDSGYGSQGAYLEGEMLDDVVSRRPSGPGSPRL